MSRRETAKDFIERIKSLPKPDLTDKRTMVEFGNRIDLAVRPEIERQDRLQARSLSRAFTKVVR